MGDCGFRITVNQACYSGSMMSHLYGENRILISATDSGHEAWTEMAFRLGRDWLHPPYQRGDYAEHYNGNYYDENYSYPQMEYNMLAPEKIYL